MLNTHLHKKLLASALFLLVGSLVFATTQALAAPQDYRFEVTASSFHASKKVTVHVRLIHASTGKAIADATLGEPKLIMIMPGMADMDGHAVNLPPAADGTYRVAADLVAPGDWVLNLSAQVPGEKETVRSALKLQVVK